MQISMVMSGFSAGKADKLRKAIGKKKIDIMRALKQDWCDGAVANDYPLDLANKIWDDVEKFAKYAFNKSHSAAYAILVMRTAYMKAHYPNEFMAAVLTSYMTKNERLIKYIASCNHNGTKVLPPDVNTSNGDFTPVDNGIRFGLIGLRGVGSDVAEAIVAEREKNGPYKHLHDFVNRLTSKQCNHRVLEALIKGGAFDSTGYSRKQMWYFVEDTSLLENARKHEKQTQSGQTSLMDLFGDNSQEDLGDIADVVPEPDGIEWPKMEMLKFEKEIMNMYVTDNPVRPYMVQISQKAKYNVSQLKELNHSIPSGVFGGMISEVSLMRTKKGKMMSKFNLEDITGTVECICFNHEKFQEKIVEDKIVLIKGKFEKGDRGDQIIAYDVIDLVLDPRFANKEYKFTKKSKEIANFEIFIKSIDVREDKIACMNQALNETAGPSNVIMHVIQNDGKNIRCQMPFKVNGEDSVLREKLQRIFEGNIRFN